MNIEWDVSELPRLWQRTPGGFVPVWGLDRRGNRRPRRQPFYTCRQVANALGVKVEWLRRMWWRSWMDPALVTGANLLFRRVGDQLVPSLEFSIVEGVVVPVAVDGADVLNLEQAEAVTGISARRLKRAWLFVLGWILQPDEPLGVTNHE